MSITTLMIVNILPINMPTVVPKLFTGLSHLLKKKIHEELNALISFYIHSVKLFNSLFFLLQIIKSRFSKSE